MMPYLKLNEEWDIGRLDKVSVDDILDQSKNPRTRQLLVIAFLSMEVPEADRLRLDDADIPLVEDVPDDFKDATDGELVSYLRGRLAVFVSIEPPLVPIPEDPFWRDARRLLSDEERQKLLRLINGEDDYED